MVESVFISKPIFANNSKETFARSACCLAQSESFRAGSISIFTFVLLVAELFQISSNNACTTSASFGTTFFGDSEALGFGLGEALGFGTGDGLGVGVAGVRTVNLLQVSLFPFFTHLN